MKQLLLSFLMFGSFSLFGQINFTANDQVPSYNGTFGYGVNPGSNSGWDDEAEADISAGNPNFGVQGVGCNTMRPPLPEVFLETWGYDVRLDEYQYFETLGIRDLTVFIGTPSDEHRDPNSYCPTNQSKLFDNMYLPIWDNGLNGTPVNDDNHYAIYVYRMLNIYKDHVKFWEIWNEPDFDYSSSGYLDPGQAGNWWENVPDPCDYKLRAPVYHYIRLLRISYEVIKYVDPDAFVAVGGLGYESFLDIIMRHSDNPDNGIVNAEYPLTGGAYFDALSYHSYPHFSLKEYDNDIGGFVFSRHSDAAMEEVIKKKNDFNAVLQNYNYDGNTYPEKVWLITESNVPAANFDEDYFGSIEGQRNFVIKTVVACQKNDILQYHIYKLGEDYPIGQGFNEFDRMGLYENLDDVDQYDQVMTQEGMAYKTTSDLIGDAFFNADKTADLNLPANVDGAAFRHPDDSYTYVLWAKTSIDDSEVASATYSFPAAMNVNLLNKMAWDFSQTNIDSEIGANNIELTGAPIFLKDISVSVLPPNAAFSYSSNNACAPFSVSFSDNSINNPTTWNWSFPGGSPLISNLQNPTVTYANPGTYTATLLVSNNGGNDAVNISLELGSDLNGELNLDLCFGDEIIVNGMIYNEANPSGTEILEGGGLNGCDSTVVIDLSFAGALESQVYATICDGDFYDFGGDDLSETGVYNLDTIATSGCDSTVTLNLTVEDDIVITPDIELCFGDEIIINGVVYNEDNPLGIETFEGGSANGCDSTVIIELSFLAALESLIDTTLCAGDFYVFGGQDLSQTGVYTFETTAANGCDSIIILDLTVEEAVIISSDIDLCEGEEYNGVEYEEDTTIQEISISVNGCDSSIHNISIHILDESFTEIEATILEGESYQIGNSTYTESGVYYDILVAQNGCDSIIELTLTVDQTDAVFDFNDPKKIDLQAFPNPFSAKVNINFLSNRQDFIALEVYDTNGNKITQVSKEQSYFNERHYFILDFLNTAKGVYWCKIQLKEGVYTQKLVLL